MKPQNKMSDMFCTIRIKSNLQHFDGYDIMHAHANIRNKTDDKNVSRVPKFRRKMCSR